MPNDRGMAQMNETMLNATAKQNFDCPACGALIKQGDRLLMFRERATSSAEARNAGTLYPMRKRCVACATKRETAQMGAVR